MPLIIKFLLKSSITFRFLKLMVLCVRSLIFIIMAINSAVTAIKEQEFSLASAIGHSPKIVPDVREFVVQFGQFVRDDFRKCTLYGYAQ